MKSSVKSSRKGHERMGSKSHTPAGKDQYSSERSNYERKKSGESNMKSPSGHSQESSERESSGKEDENW